MPQEITSDTRARLIAMQSQARTIDTILTSTLGGIGHSGSNADMIAILDNVKARAGDIARDARKLRADTFAGSPQRPSARADRLRAARAPMTRLGMTISDVKPDQFAPGEIADNG